MSQILKDQEIIELFDRFSSPLLKPCINKTQRESASIICKTLWLFLVKGADTEEKIYKALYESLKNHDSATGIGSLYYYKMKKTLTKKEIEKLKKYYANKDNFDKLKDWANKNILN